MAHPVYTFILCWSSFIFRSGKSEGDEDDIETEDAPSMDDVKNIKLPDVKEDDSKSSILGLSNKVSFDSKFFWKGNKIVY